MSNASPLSHLAPSSSPDGWGSWRQALTACSVIVTVLLAGAAACASEKSPKKTVAIRRTESQTLIAADARGRLRIGVREDVPYMFFIERGGRRTGFEIEIAKALAFELGFSEDKIDWVPVQTLPQRQAVLQQNIADMVVANFSMTAEREQYVDFAGPYQLVPQQVLVRRDRTKSLETIADLRRPGIRVCTTTGSTSEKALVDKGIEPEPVNTNAQCIAGLKRGMYDAFSTDLPILAGLAKADQAKTGEETFELLDLAIADYNEKIGVGLPNGDTAMRDVVAYFLHKWRTGTQYSPWRSAYDKTIGPLLGSEFASQPHVDNPPDLADFDSKAPR